MSQRRPLRVAVIGAGMAGLACAGALHRAGAAVTLFDKSRRAAQYATARDAAETRPGLVSDTEGDVAGPFDRVVVALPAPQAAGLLRSHAFAADAARTRMAPCWAAMLAFDEATAAPDLLRPNGPLCWVAHTRPEWSRDHLEQPAEAVLALLRNAFVAVTGITAAPRFSSVHRWRCALAKAPLGTPALRDAAAGLGVCGDWCLGARVEAAFLSGQALADMMAG